MRVYLTGRAKSERNANIIESVRLGEPCSSVAKRLSVSPTHVRDIVRAATGMSVFTWRAGHYKRATQDRATRFWQTVDDTAGPDGCWPWTGFRNDAGYGLIGGRREQRAARAHRVSWELSHGPIPPGLVVCHHCDNPPCVNPAHLFIGTQADNSRDMVRKGRANRDPLPRASQPMGSRHYSAKLTEASVREVRQRVARGERQVALAVEYGVAPTTICAAVKGRNWAHVE